MCSADGRAAGGVGSALVEAVCLSEFCSGAVSADSTFGGTSGRCGNLAPPVTTAGVCSIGALSTVFVGVFFSAGTVAIGIGTEEALEWLELWLVLSSGGRVSARDSFAFDLGRDPVHGLVVEDKDLG